MKKFLLILLAFQSGHAANYLPLSTGIQLYDVEVLVFARQRQQPDSFQVSSREEIDLSELNSMATVEEDMPWLIDAEVPQEDEQWQVPIDGKKATNAKALAWFAFDDFPADNPVFQKINKSPEMRALFYQKWRQPATPYRNPGYVKISTWPEDVVIKQNDIGSDEEPNGDVSGEPDFETNTAGGLYNQYNQFEVSEPEIQVKHDYTVRGKVAFSKQRFQHGHVDVNLYRNSQDGATLVYRITQDTQIDLDHWQYFDHTQFGVMLKVSLATDFENGLNKAKE